MRGAIRFVARVMRRIERSDPRVRRLIFCHRRARLRRILRLTKALSRRLARTWNACCRRVKRRCRFVSSFRDGATLKRGFVSPRACIAHQTRRSRRRSTRLSAAALGRESINSPLARQRRAFCFCKTKLGRKNGRQRQTRLRPLDEDSRCHRKIMTMRTKSKILDGIQTRRYRAQARVVVQQDSRHSCMAPSKRTARATFSAKPLRRKSNTQRRAVNFRRAFLETSSDKPYRTSSKQCSRLKNSVVVRVTTDGCVRMCGRARARKIINACLSDDEFLLLDSLFRGGSRCGGGGSRGVADDDFMFEIIIR